MKENPKTSYTPEITLSWTTSVPPFQEKDLRELGLPLNMVRSGQLLLGEMQI